MSSFTFKQFCIQQNRCAQKVSEMACIQGAWTPVPKGADRVLDIGSGTGLLSLMLAQRHRVKIDAIEIDPSTFTQGRDNVQASPFSEQVNCLLGDVRAYPFHEPYDFIITNPPFFEGQLMAKEEDDNLAKHSSKLKLDELIEVIHQQLSATGSFSILFPMDRLSELTQSCQAYHFFPDQLLAIKHSASHKPKVLIGIFSRNEQALEQLEFIIKENGRYTPAMRALMKDFYLA